MRNLRKKMQRQNCNHRDTCNAPIECRYCDGTMQRAFELSMDMNDIMRMEAQAQLNITTEERDRLKARRAAIDKKTTDKLFPDD